ncbi:MAG: hypothetical protein EA362_06295 [Saprospirales bacterium]|nr:MAG: hypothetical protein EA362_06295 [Saprospirales bacterium]
MNLLSNFRAVTIISAVFIFSVVDVFTQCETWMDAPNSDDIISAHSVYRQALRVNDMEIAIENWKIAIEGAPAADGQRDFHFTDGVTIYKYKISQTEDEEKISFYQERIIQLYEQAADCYIAQAISLRSCSNQSCYDERAGVLLGRMVYDMFYEFNSPTQLVYNASLRTMDLAGNKTEYIVLIPAIAAVSRLYRSGQISDEDAAKNHKRIEEILKYNIENNAQFGAQFEQLIPSINHYVAQFERDLYDCDYFKERLLPQFEANPADGEQARNIFSQLRSRGCDEDDPDLTAIRKRSEEFVDSVNVAMQADLEERNPALAARRLFDEGNFTAAVERYQAAIAQEDNDVRRGEFYFAMASIQGRQLNQYNNARNNALRAAELKPNWGAPYLLVGDLYATTARSCGDDWNQRLAILAAIDKYRQAARVDSSVATDALSRANRYLSSKPERGDGHMMGISEGDRVRVNCWINETVSVRFR